MEIFESEWEGRLWLGSKDYRTTPDKIEEFYYSLKGKEKTLFDRICSSLPCAKEFMAENFRKYGWDQDVFDRCTIFTPSVLPKPVPFFAKPWCCYENSFALAQEKGFLYIEGLAINPAGPMIHAWNSTDGTNVIDYTWPCQEVNKYFGLPLNIKSLKRQGYMHGGVLGKILADHQRKCEESVQPAA